MFYLFLKFFKKTVKLKKNFRFVLLMLDPDIFVEVFKKHLVHLFVDISLGDENRAEVLEGSSIAVILLISACDEKVS